MAHHDEDENRDLRPRSGWLSRLGPAPRALGVTIPPGVLAIADEVIESVKRAFCRAFCCTCSRQLMALLGPREMSDLSPQSGPKRPLMACRPPSLPPNLR